MLLQHKAGLLKVIIVNPKATLYSTCFHTGITCDVGIETTSRYYGKATPTPETKTNNADNCERASRSEGFGSVNNFLIVGALFKFHPHFPSNFTIPL